VKLVIPAGTCVGGSTNANIYTAALSFGFKDSTGTLIPTTNINVTHLTTSSSAVATVYPTAPAQPVYFNAAFLAVNQGKYIKIANINTVSYTFLVDFSVPTDVAQIIVSDGGAGATLGQVTQVDVYTGDVYMQTDPSTFTFRKSFANIPSTRIATHPTGVPLPLGGGSVIYPSKAVEGDLSMLPDKSVMVRNTSGWRHIGAIPWVSVSLGQSLEPDGKYLVNSSAGAITLSLPDKSPNAPYVGCEVHLLDEAGTWATNNVTIALPIGSTYTIMGATTPFTLNTNNQKVTLVFTGADWRVA